MALSFAERMAALKKQPNIPASTIEPEPAPAPTPAPATKRVFGQPMPAISVSGSPTIKVPVQVPVQVPAPALPEYTVGNIIDLANEANKIAIKDKTEGEALVEGAELPYDAIRIKQRIQEIQLFEGVSLRNEMAELKKLIKASPDACLYLMPEELGLMVRALRKMTDNKVAMDMGATKARASTKKDTKMSAEELAAALDDL